MYYLYTGIASSIWHVTYCGGVSSKMMNHTQIALVCSLQRNSLNLDMVVSKEFIQNLQMALKVPLTK
jgi:hypothetical protein